MKKVKKKLRRGQLIYIVEPGTLEIKTAKFVRGNKIAQGIICYRVGKTESYITGTNVFTSKLAALSAVIQAMKRVHPDVLALNNRINRMAAKFTEMEMLYSNLEGWASKRWVKPYFKSKSYIMDYEATQH